MADTPTTKNLKDVIREEYVKCLKNPLYFMKKYVKIQHPTRGTLPFLTYPFQDTTLEQLIKYDQNIILKCRQMGITTLVSAYSLWLMLFHDSKEILCLSITQETSKAIVTKVRFGYDNLPSWLKLGTPVEDNRLSLKLSNGSRIVAASSATSSPRSSALSLLIVDEAAFIEKIEEIWLAAAATTSTGGKKIILSTPNGVGNFFHKKWVESEQGLNNLNRIKLPWYLHPDHDQKWRDDQTKISGAKGSAQECDCEFSTSGNTVIDIPILQWYEETQCMEPLEKRGSDRGLWIFKYPVAGKDYMVSADVGRGDAADFSAAQVLDIETLEQVAEYKGKLPTKQYAQALMTISTDYNMGLLVVENANVGWAVIQEILDKGYPNLFYNNSVDSQYVEADMQMTNKINAQEKKMVPGFTTSNKSRPLLISKLESYIRNKEAILHSKRLLDELNVFIWKSVGTASSRAEAMNGYNDDLVLALAIGLWIRDTALRLRKDSDTLMKTILTKIGASTKDQVKENMKLIQRGGTNPYGIYNNPWQMQVGGHGTSREPLDLTWLL